MPRLPRVEFEYATYHVTSRGNNRCNLFLDPEDFVQFLAELSCIIYEYDWRCYSYCLMNNHYHMTLQTPSPNLSKGMRKLHTVYSVYYRKKYTFTGSLFEGRYDASIISDDSYVLEAIRYDLLNTVRANITKNPGDWKWSSFNETAGFEEESDWIDNTWVRSLFDDKTLPAKNFIAFTTSGIR